MAVTIQSVGNLLIGRRLGLRGRQDNPTPEGQRLRRRPSADQSVERIALFGGKNHGGGKRTWHWRLPCGFGGEIQPPQCPKSNWISGPLAANLRNGHLAHVVTAKLADHTPMHRLAGQLARSGVTIATSTLGDWLFRASELLTPLYELMHTRLLLSRVIHGDDTSVKLRVRGSSRTTKAHLWVCLGDADDPYVLFDFTPAYTAEGPARFLKGYKGYFQSHALSQYQGLYSTDTIQHLCCVAHARSKFVTANEAGDERAVPASEILGKLYSIERMLPPLLLPSDDPTQRELRRQREEQRCQLRQRDAERVWAEFSNWVGEQKPGALPKSPLGTAIGYALNNCTHPVTLSITHKSRSGYTAARLR
jgi:transposase